MPVNFGWHDVFGQKKATDFPDVKSVAGGLLRALRAGFENPYFWAINVIVRDGWIWLLSSFSSVTILRLAL